MSMKYDPDVNYIICPDASCTGFTDKILRCGKDCPNEKMQWMIYCPHCKREIYLPKDHCSACRVDCKCGAALFTRMQPTYVRINRGST